jgi:predicted PurR-regulated permease PerM
VATRDNEPDSRTERVFESARRHNVPLRTILTTVGIVVAVYGLGQALYRLRSLCFILLIGGFIALILNPGVNALARHIKRRGAAVAIVVIVAMLIFGALAVAFGYPLVNGLTHLANQLPNQIRQAQSGHGFIGHLIRKYHVEKWFANNSSKLVSLANGLSKPALALGKGALSAVFTLFTVFFFVVLLLAEGPKLRQGALALIPSRHLESVTRIGHTITTAASGYVVGGLINSAIAAVVMLITMLIMGVPFALLFALWVLLVDFLPQIGGLLAGVPVAIIAFVHSTSAGVVVTVVFIAFTLIQNHVLYPIVMARAVKVNSLLVFLSILVFGELGSWGGGTFGAFVGVLLAVPVAATIHAVVAEVWQATHPAK